MNGCKPSRSDLGLLSFGGRLICSGLLAMLALTAVSEQATAGGRGTNRHSRIRRVVAPDAIPAIDNPVFTTAAQARIGDDEPVIGISINGDHRAYSIYLLNHHEVVNDVVGEQPIVVAWCALANLVAVYKRELDEETYRFGVSGSLLKNTLLMSDRRGRFLWTAMSGEALDAEDPLPPKLELIGNARRTSWRRWRQLHPDTKVLSVAGVQSPGHDIYADYHKSRLRRGIHPVRNNDGRVQPKTNIVGIDVDGTHKAYPFDLFERTKIISDDFAGIPLLIYHDPHADITAVYDRFVDGTELEFEDLPKENFYRGSLDTTTDTLTGSRWDLATGEATTGPMAGSVLEPVPFTTVYWYAWADYFPRTRVYP